MRKSTLSVLISAFSFSLYAQTYIQYDAQCMDRFEYKYLQSESNNVAHTTYRVNKNQIEKLYLETAEIESQVVNVAPAGLLPCSDIQLNRADIIAINRGEKPVYLCKKLDSGWFITPVTGAAYMSYDGRNLVFQGGDFNIKADYNQTLAGVNLSDGRDANMSDVQFSGQIEACNQIASVFKKAPNAVCNVEATVTIIPSVGLVQNFCDAGQKVELMTINGISVCDYLSQNNAPVVIASREPTPENIPTQYSNTPIVSDKPITRADFFGEDIPASATITTSTPSVMTPVPSTSSNDVVAEKTPTVAATPKVDCNTVAKEGEHVVLEGESLYSIARRYGITVSSIRTWNNLSNDVIYPCSVIKTAAPSETVSTQPQPQPSMTETRTQDVPMSYVSVPKKEQTIVAEAPTPAPAKETKKSDCNTIALEGEHVVQKGESLYAIARMYNVKIDQIRTWNSLKSDVINPCQKLTITEPQVQTKGIPTQYSTVVKPKTTQNAVAMVKKEDCLHVVKKGETISGLSKQFGLKEADLRKFNNLGKDDKILIGQVLRKQSEPCFVEQNLPKTYSVAIKPKSAVKKGETELSLEPVDVQPKKEDIPQEYSTIVMPKPIKVKESEVTAKSGDLKTRKYHIVQENETLEAIAKTYGLTVEKLRTLNDLDKKEIVVQGQLLNLQ